MWSYAAAEEPIVYKPITFQEIAKSNGPIEVRGFLYADSKGQWILADKPNIRSCCLDKEAVRVVVRGDIPAEGVGNRVVKLRGNLHEESPRQYLLDNAWMNK